MSFVSRYLDPALIERLNYLQLSARSVVEGSITGQHRSPLKGASIEFRQHRFYVPGDEPRRLDWRVLGRTDRPYIKEYDEETNLRCLLMLDCSGSMAYAGRGGGATARDSKFEYACKIVSALAYLMLGQTESVGLALFEQKITQWLAPRSGTMQLSRVIDLLERAAPRGQANLDNAMREAADRLGRRSLVIVVSDWFAPPATLRAGFARLGHARHETIALQALDRDEIEFPFQSWTRLRGLEGERAALCEPAAIRSRYLANFAAHRRLLAEACRSNRIEFHSIVTDKAPIDSITAFLHRRAR